MAAGAPFAEEMLEDFLGALWPPVVVLLGFDVAFRGVLLMPVNQFVVMTVRSPTVRASAKVFLLMLLAFRFQPFGPGVRGVLRDHTGPVVVACRVMEQMRVSVEMFRARWAHSLLAGRAAQAS